MLKKIITTMVSLLTIGGAFANPQKAGTTVKEIIQQCVNFVKNIVKRKVISSTKTLEFGCRLNLKNQKTISL